jgi:hypothetical protein
MRALARRRSVISRTTISSGASDCGSSLTSNHRRSRSPPTTYSWVTGSARRRGAEGLARGLGHVRRENIVEHPPDQAVAVAGFAAHDVFEDDAPSLPTMKIVSGNARSSARFFCSLAISAHRLFCARSMKPTRCGSVGHRTGL